MDEVKVNIFSIVGQEDCTLPEDGDKVYKTIQKILNENKKASLSFLHVNKLTTAFFKLMPSVSFMANLMKIKSKKVYRFKICPTVEKCV